MGDLLSSLYGCKAIGCGYRVLDCLGIYLIVQLSTFKDERFNALRVSLYENVRPVGIVDLMKSIGIPYLLKI